MAENNKKIFRTESGIELPLLAVSDVELVPVYQRFEPQRPQPPVEVLPNGRQITNEAHPDYQKALADYNMRLGMFGWAVLVEFGVDIELDEAQQALVEKRRRKRERVNPGAPENEFDVYVYVSAFCCQSADEIKRLSEAIKALNTPTEAQVQAHLDTFRPDIPWPAIDGNPDPGVGDRVAIGQE